MISNFVFFATLLLASVTPNFASPLEARFVSALRQRETGDRHSHHGMGDFLRDLDFGTITEISATIQVPLISPTTTDANYTIEPMTTIDIFSPGCTGSLYAGLLLVVDGPLTVSVAAAQSSEEQKFFEDVTVNPLDELLFTINAYSPTFASVTVENLTTGQSGKVEFFFNTTSLCGQSGGWGVAVVPTDHGNPAVGAPPLSMTDCSAAGGYLGPRDGYTIELVSKDGELAGIPVIDDGTITFSWTSGSN